MTQIALTVGGVNIYWNAVLICLGIAACFCLTWALFTANGGQDNTLLLLLPLGMLFSVLIARTLHWDCHIEQYPSLFAALTDYSTGGFCMPGVLLGTALAVLCVRALGFTGNAGRLFDCLAPGAALGIALIRLSNLFTSADRAKIVVTTPFLQHLPIAAPVTAASGVEYRFATFFWQFLLMLLMSALLLRFFFKRRRAPMKADQPRDGNVALLFLNWYSALELVADSTRYDGSFLRINGFVSLGQIVAAFSLLGVLIVYTVRSRRAGSSRSFRIVHWVLFWLSIGVVGGFEYLVQRFGGMYLICYTVMSLACAAAATINLRMYRSVRKTPTPRRAGR